MENQESPEQEIKVPNLEIPEKKRRRETPKKFDLERMRKDLKNEEREDLEKAKEDAEKLYEGTPNKKGGKFETGDKSKTEKDIRQNKQDQAVEIGWDRLSDKEKEKYKNEEGKPDIERYAEELEEKRDEVNELLQKDDVFLSEDVFYEMINRGYKPEKIYISSLQEKVIGFMGSGFSGAMMGGFMGSSFGGPLGGLIGIAGGGIIGPLWHQLIREAGETDGIKIPVASGGKLRLTEGNFRNLVETIAEDVKKSIDREIKERVA